MSTTNNNLKEGIYYSFSGSLVGFIGVIYFKYVSFIGHYELVVHRCLWTAFSLILTTFYFSKWKIFFI